ncbi:MAG TPA: glycosyltransferase family 39 protein [Polyangiaceae bacterium]|jgi:hypothetical protein|nr:glycosyltransferase family 39 protein [Polyangiaceae bacterium]
MSPPRRRWLSPNLPAWIAFGCAFLLLLGAHVFFLRPPTLLHLVDEGYVNAFAWRMVEGRMLPFVDAVSQRGPVMYWAAAVAVWLGNPTSWAPIRVTSMLCGLMTIAFTFAAAWRARRPLMGAVAALGITLVFLVAMPVSDGLAYSGEHLLNAFMMPALTCLVMGLDRERARPSVKLVAAAGALAALAALSKQFGAVAIGPLGLWVIAVAVSRPGLDRRARWRLVGAFAAGVAVPVALVVARYLAAGELGTLFYYTVTYNAKIYVAPYSTLAKLNAYGSWTAKYGVLLGILGPLGMWAVTRPVFSASGIRDLPRAYDEHGFLATVGLGSLMLVIASNASFRDFIHYYIIVVPWCGLLFGALVEHLLEARSSAEAEQGEPGGYRPALVRAFVLLPLITVTLIGSGQRFARHARDINNKEVFDDGRTSALCAFIKENSKPDDSLFVWGFSPQYYTACERKPASRYVFTTFPAGFVPWFTKATKEEDEERTVPGSRELLIEDLERSRPPVIVDASKSMGNRPMRRYEALAAYLAKHYCPTKKEGLEVFLRRDEEGRCPRGLTRGR